MLIVIYHSYNYLHARGLIPEVPGIVDVGQSGVDIFFVISGFIMVFISGEKFNKSGAPKDFLVRRIIRVVPTYWAYTFLVAFLLYFFPGLFNQGRDFDYTRVMASLFFIPWENSHGLIKPIYGVGWTLNFEIYFYLIFSVLLFLSKKYFLPLLSLILVGGAIIGVMANPEPHIYYVMTSKLLIEFLMGCFIASWYMKDTKISQSLSVLMIMTGIAAIVATGILDVSLSKVIKWGFPSACIVSGFVFLERSREIKFHPFLIRLGDSSYSLYLTHVFAISAIGLVWRKTFGSMYDIFIFVAIFASLLLGYMAFILFEKPITVYLNKLYK